MIRVPSEASDRSMQEPARCQQGMMPTSRTQRHSTAKEKALAVPQLSVIELQI